MDPRTGKWVVAALVVWSAFCAVGIAQLQFSYDIDRFFPQNDPALVHYHNHKAQFADDMRSLLIAVELPRALDKEGLERIDGLTRSLTGLPFVSNVRSLTTISEPLKLPLGEWIQVRFFPPPFDDVGNGLQRLAERKALKAILLSDANKAAVIVLQLEPIADVAKRSQLLADIRKRCFSTGMPFHLAGRLATQAHYLQATRDQLGLLGGLAVLFMLVVSWLTFRHLLTALIPLLVSAMALLWTFGPMGWIGVGIEPLLSLLPALLLVLGSSFSIHIISRFRGAMRSSVDPASAMRSAISSTNNANTLSALSVAIGFGSLAFYPVLPLRTFGAASAWGMIAALIAARALIPLLVDHIAIARTERSSTSARSKLAPVLRRRPAILVFSALLTIGGAFLLTRLEVRNHFLDDLDRSSTLGRDVGFFERHFAGTRPLEITIEPADTTTSLLDPTVLAASEQLCTAIGQRFGVAPPLGPPDLVRTAMRALHLGDRLPQGTDEVETVRRVLKQWQRQGSPIKLVSGDLRTGRIAGRTPDVGSTAFKEKLDALAPLLNNAHITSTITGGAWLMDMANANIARTLVQGLLSAILLNTLLIGLALRSWRKAFMSVWPNVLPLAVAALIMWFFNLPLKVGTAMIFPVLYGIALDDTIHFLFHQRHIERKGGVMRTSAVRTWHHLHGPLLNTSLIVSAGFALLGLSSFESVSVFGLVTAASLWVALAADLWLLPALIVPWRLIKG
ncbi:MAG: MMPL family transporter [Flavobacteriales bacterium]|nr:MMPL family transporter [Flavobacteriales bacterium]